MVARLTSAGADPSEEKAFHSITSRYGIRYRLLPILQMAVGGSEN